MVRRSTQPPSQQPALTSDQIRRRIERLQKCIDELQTFDPREIQKRHNVPEVLALEASITDALSAAFGHGTARYNIFKRAADLDQGPLILRGDPMFGGLSEADYEAQDAIDSRRYLAEGRDRSIALLQRAIGTLQDDIADKEPDGQAMVSRPATALRGRKVFVVHGRDEASREAMARFLEKIGLEAIILHEQPDRGLTVIEKFEVSASQVSFAVVLLTPDDVGGRNSESTQFSRARQNVIFELGYFVGALGRGRACLLRKGDIEIPSDLYGVIYTDMDAAGGWKLTLVRELKAAGLDFDTNKIWE